MVTEVIAGLALPLSWVPAQVHCVCLLPAGAIISPVRWSRNKEGASPSTVPFCLWTSTVNRAKRFWSEILACETDVVPPPFILWFLPVLGHISCRNSYWTQQFWDLFNKQLSCLPRGARNAAGRTETAMALFCLCLWVPKGPAQHLNLPYLCNIQHFFMFLLIWSHFCIKTLQSRAQGL